MNADNQPQAKRMTCRNRATAALALALLMIIAIAGGALAHGIHGTQIKALSDGGPLTYLASGAIHMLTGYDHLLFLFGVMFFLTAFWEIVTFITAFTIGHSITLIGATLTGVEANYFLIDAAIAGSVIYKGFDNLDGFRRYFGVAAPSILLMVLVFGLIHGIGLASRFQQLPLPKEGLLPRLLAFNVGVEIGQIAALAVMLAVLTLWRRSTTFKPFATMANTGLVATGILLFLMQVHLYMHYAYPDEFGFSTNAHIVDHYENDVFSGDPAFDSPPKPELPAAPTPTPSP